ncbi:MAG TPA: M15 family metallopeptidase [Candidatus Acidoferrales bacterium]|nr:M15 family metallopeptidase [Candidatus Acidoferrales bacterium]
MSALQQEFAQSAAKLIQKAAELGYAVTFGEAWRTPQQAQWDAQHGTGIAHSLHTDRLAIDLDFFKDGVWITDGSKLADVGAWWKSLGANYRWGGDFHHLPDGNHFSISPDGVTA